MQVEIKRIDNTLPMPEYKTKGAVAFDLYSRIDETIAPQTFKLIPNNIIVKIPENYMLMIAARSSLLHKKGLVVRNGVGIIDQDYHGPSDELLTLVYNTTNEPVTIQKGERLSQAVFVQIAQATLIDADRHFKEDSRGGFGSTG